MSERHLPIGIGFLALSGFGCFYLVRALVRAVEGGGVRGRYGDWHPAGSLEFGVYVAGCLIGVALLLGLGWMALGWVGIIRRSGR